MQNQKSKKDDSYYYRSYKNNGNNLLVNYSNLLLPFYKKSAVKEYFKKLEKVEDYNVKTNIYGLMLHMGIEVSDDKWEALAADNINRNFLYTYLKDKKHFQYLKDAGRFYFNKLSYKSFFCI